MNDEIKFASDHSDVESRVFAFRSCMEPALHLFPESIVERLKGGGFFTALASEALWSEIKEKAKPDFHKIIEP